MMMMMMLCVHMMMMIPLEVQTFAIRDPTRLGKVHGKGQTICEEEGNKVSHHGSLYGEDIIIIIPRLH